MRGSRSKGWAVLAVLALVLFLTAKLAFRSTHSNLLLYLYGVTVTSVVLLQMLVAFTRYRDPAVEERSASSADEAPLVSCLVAVFNDEAIIHQCVESLVAQTYVNKEIIVVNDASTDGTIAELRRLAHIHPIRVIDLPHNVGKKHALSEAVLQCSGDIIAFSDSDSIWAPDVLDRIVPIFTNEDVGAVSGHCRALNGGRNLLTKVQDSWYEGQFSVRKAFESAFGAVTCVSGPLAVFRRAAIYNFMPAWTTDSFLGQEFLFATDRTLTGFVLGGKDVGVRLRDEHAASPFMTPQYPLKNWRVVYCKSARAWTEVPDTWRRLLRQQIRWKKSFVRNLFFTGRFYWRRPFLPALVYYLHVLFVFAGPLIAFRHLLYTPMHGNIESMFFYLFGILLIGAMFSLAFRREDPKSGRWIYRPLMSLSSTLVLSWLVLVSLLTIKRMKWDRQ